MNTRCCGIKFVVSLTLKPGIRFAEGHTKPTRHLLKLIPKTTSVILITIKILIQNKLVSINVLQGKRLPL